MPPEEYIVIRGLGSISPLGCTHEAVQEAYKTGKPGFQNRFYNNLLSPVGALSETAEAVLKKLSSEKKAYQGLDKSVLMAMYAARQAIKEAGWQDAADIAVNIGSSRGATELFEQYITEFQASGKVSPIASPVTTLGNISSWVANDLQTQGPVISHSVTCSTALQAVANGFAWLKSGMATKFLAGGAEAPLTPFTIAQMKAIDIYTEGPVAAYPCRPQNKEKKNTFVLGEGAAVFALEKMAVKRNLRPEPQIILEAVGMGFENIASKTGISKEGNNFQLAIKDALQKAGSPDIDLIIMHAPGTVAGDAAELNAIKTIFAASKLPILTSNKFLIGHTLGASAALSLEYAIHILKNQSWLALPYANVIPGISDSKPINRILLTAAGFGGNAVSLIVSKTSN